MVTKKKPEKKESAVHASGKRKRSVARATLRKGTGVVRINSQLISLVQPEMARLRLEEPLKLAGDAAKSADIDVNVCGGGWSSQTEAARLAIARAMIDYTKDESLRKTYLDYDRHLLVADTRYKEQKKPLTHSRARAKRQLSFR